jgi:TonB family protein
VEFPLRTLLILFFLAASVTIHAQSPQSQVVDARDLRIVKQTSAVYPPIAMAAHVSGQVNLQITIGIDGHVTSAKAISGPPMLIGSAQECIRQWVYEPVLMEGKPVTISTTVTIRFDLSPSVNPNDKEIASRFFPLDQACIKAVSSNIDPDQQADLCKKAADVAQTFSDKERFIERRSAFVYASSALRRDKQSGAALDYANKAVAVVEQGHDDGSGSSAAYAVRAQAEGELGDLATASDDLTKAEGFERRAIAEMGNTNGEFVKKQYVPVLKGLLNLHVRVLSAMGKPEESEAKAAEAGKL